MISDFSSVINACHGLGMNSILAGGSTRINCSNGLYGLPMLKSIFKSPILLKSLANGA